MMLYWVVFTLCLCAVFAVPTRNPHLDQHWNHWKNAHKKKYNEPQERHRRQVWEKNWEKIELHNLQYSSRKQSFLLGMNEYGDMTSEEFTQLMNGYRSTSNESVTGDVSLASNTFKAPPQVDWRMHGYVTPVKYQGLCRSCWAFSSTGAMEGQLFKKTGKLLSLSEQNLVDCSRPEGNQGCNGGLMERAFQHVKNNKGLNTEESYPYLAKDDQPCRYDPNGSAANSTGFVSIVHGNETALMTAVATVGPVSVAIDASHPSFQFYRSGIYYEPACSSTALDHGVLVVGYGEDNSSKYWIVKNSWGASWGENGYIHIAKDKQNHCGIATAASYPLM